MTDDKLVVPGDVLGTAEEYMPGNGAYESEGRILAARVGIAVFDDSEKVASVVFSGERVMPLESDVVFGTVLESGAKIVQVRILALERNGRGMPTGNQGVIHITKMSENFVDNPKRLFRPGDIVRARIVQLKPSIQLSTADPELGIVKAYCGKCRLALVRKGRDLHCTRCGTTEPRKASEHYDMPLILKGGGGS